MNRYSSLKTLYRQLYFSHPAKPFHKSLALGASYSSIAPDTTARETTPKRTRKGNKWLRLAIHTLLEEKLSRRDHMDIRGYSAPFIGFPREDPVDAPPKSRLFFSQLHVKPSRSTTALPWPENSRGFLYYYKNPPGTDFAASGIRFRSTPTDNPKDFYQGFDVTTPQGIPWFIPILSLFSGRMLQGFREQLIHEGVLTPELFVQCQNAAKECKWPAQKPSKVLFSFDQPFGVEFNKQVFRLAAFKDWQMVHGEFRGLFSDYRDHGRKGDFTPYKGKAIARFELTPDSKVGNRKVQLRFLKIVSLEKTPGYDGHFSRPEQGMLLGRLYASGTRPWTASIDGPKGNKMNAAMFRHLLDGTAALPDVPRQHNLLAENVNNFGTSAQQSYSS